MRDFLLGYLIAIDALTFIDMLIDKFQASQHSRRDPAFVHLPEPI